MNPLKITETQIVRAIRERLSIFWNKVNKTDGCWTWKASKNGLGYGKFCIGHQKLELAHRVSWRIYNGEIPFQKLILHKCDNPSCVNPNHLFLGSHKDNSLDASYKRRMAFGLRNGMYTHPETRTTGERNAQAKLKWDGIKKIRKMVLSGKTYGFISEVFGVTTSCIGKIARKERWVE